MEFSTLKRAIFLCYSRFYSWIYLITIIPAAKSLQSCPTLCDPIDGSPPGSPIPWILQARVPEWGAIAFNTIIPNPPKNVIFIIGDWNAKVGSQEIPGVTGKFGLGVQKEVGQRLIEFCQDNSLVTANTLFQKHKRRLYTWTSPDGQYRNQTDYILWSQKWRSSIQLAKTRLRADCGPDHGLLIAKFRLKLKKVGKTTRPFR